MPKTSIGQNTGTFNADIISCLNLFINGQSLSQILSNLNIGDQFEQQEIDELKLLVQYLNTSGLSSEWIVDNNNKNQDLKTLITQLQTKLQNIDTTSLFQTSILNNDNRNSVLKSALDSLSSSVGTLDGKTRYVSSVQGNNTAPKVASDFQVSINDRDKRSIYLTTGANFISSINDSTNMATPGNYSDNKITLESVNGMITSTAHLNQLRGTTVEITGPLGMGTQSDTTIKLGQGGALIEIGSIDTPQLFPETNTRIKIGKKSATRNTETTLAGNILIANARFTELAVSNVLTWQNFLALISTTNMPTWIASSILSSLLPNFNYSDLFAMKGTVTKEGDIETIVSPKVKNLTIYDSDIGIDILPKVTTFIAKGDSSETILTGSIRKQIFNGEILLQNHNIVSTNVDWITSGSGNLVNYFKISNNDIECVAAAGSQNSQMRFVNATGGRFRFRSGTNTGIQSNCHDALSIFGNQASSQVVIAGNDAPSGYDTNTKLLVDHQNLQNGIKVTNHQNALITRIDHNNVNTPSLTLQSSWNGSTAKTLYLNANDELYYNGAKVNLGGGASGGITYYVGLVNSISPAASPPLEQTMSTTYTARPQQTITQAISANTAYYIADYATEVFNKIANPILSGVQQLNQYARWNSQNQTGNLYGRLWFQATSPINNILWNKTFSNPILTSYSTVINGTPILIPNGIYNLVFPRIVFPGIDIEPDIGQTAQLSCRIEARPVSTGTFATLYNYGGATINFSSNTLNQTITFSASTFTHNQTSNTPVFHNAIRLVLTCSNGQIRQSMSGAATNAGAYRIESTGAETASIRILLKDTSSTPVIIPYSLTPILTEIDLPIDTPYDISAFNYSTLSSDVYFIQPSGGFAGHTIQLYFNEGTITHFHSTVAQTGAVSDILAGTNINVTNNGGAYTISNAAQVTNVTSSGNIGVSINNTTATITNSAPTQSVVAGPGINIVTNNFVSTINNGAPVQNVAAGSGINVSIASGTATISTIGGGAVGAASDGTNALISGSTSAERKIEGYGDYWASFATGTHMFMDTYVSSNGSIVGYATRANTTYQSGPLISSNYGTQFFEVPATNGRVHREWASICGTLIANKIWVVSNRVLSGGVSIGFNQIWSSTDLFTTMTQEPAPADFANNNRVIEMMRVSGDGKYMLITHISDPNSNYASIYKSSNYGASWIKQDLAGTLGWTRGCAMSVDGKYQFVCVDGTSGNARADTGCGGIYRSIDFGDSWTRTLLPVNSAQIRRIACNGTGQIVLIADCADTRISYDYGATWVNTSTLMGGNTRCVALNLSGSIIYYGFSDGTLYLSQNYGRTWALSNNTPISWASVSISSMAINNDGTVIFAGNINETRRISFRENQTNVRAFSIGSSSNGLIATYNPGGEIVLELAAPMYQLWYNSTVNFTGSSSVSFSIPTISLETHNLRYEIEFNWDRKPEGFNACFINMGFNNLFPETNSGISGGQLDTANTIWMINFENSAAGDGVAGTNQFYYQRFFIGYSASQGGGDQFRYRTTLNGELDMTRRGLAQTANLGTFNYDWQMDSRLLTNRFVSNSHVNRYTNNGRSRFYANGANDLNNGLNQIVGTAVWEWTENNLWFNAGSTGNTALQNGISTINLRLTNAALTAVTRDSNVNLRLWRVRKT